MARIPSKQLHREGTLDDLQNLLSNREIGICTTDKLCYVKYGGVLIPVGSAILKTPDETSLLMGYEDPEHPGSYKYGWRPFTLSEAPYDSDIHLWTHMAGMGIMATAATLDSAGRDIAQSLDDKVDSTGVTPGTYTKVAVNGQGAVTEGMPLEASDIPVHEHSAGDITSGILDPGRLGDGSIPPEKLEVRKLLKVDGTTIGATETMDSVVINARPGMEYLAYTDLSQSREDWELEYIPDIPGKDVAENGDFVSMGGGNVGYVWNIDRSGSPYTCEVSQVEGLLATVNEVWNRYHNHGTPQDFEYWIDSRSGAIMTQSPHPQQGHVVREAYSNISDFITDIIHRVLALENET